MEADTKAGEADQSPIQAAGAAPRGSREMGGQPDIQDTHTCPGGHAKLGLNFALSPSKLPLTDTGQGS